MTVENREKQDAAKLLEAIEKRVGKPARIRRIAKARKVSRRHADIVKAAEMVLAEIQESVARCEALERDL